MSNAMTMNASNSLQIDVWRTLFAILLIIGAIGGSYWIVPLDAPLTQLEIRGNFDKLQPQEIRRIAKPLLEANFFAADVSGIANAVAELPWVAHVKVERKWPGQLLVQVQERNAIARWNETSVLDEDSNSFTPRPEEIPTGLPQLGGRLGHESEVMHAWTRISAALAGTPLDLESLRLNTRGQWIARTRNHIEIRFGKAQPDARLPALLGAGIQALDGRWHQIEYIDLRYTNGFAVGWRQAALDPGSNK